MQRRNIVQDTNDIQLTILLPFATALLTGLAIQARDLYTGTPDSELKKEAKDAIAGMLYAITILFTLAATTRLFASLVVNWKHLNSAQRAMVTVSGVAGICNLGYIFSRVGDIGNREKNILAVGTSGSTIIFLESAAVSAVGMWRKKSR